MSGKEIVLITGSSGFIGSALAEKLSSNCEVIGVDRDLPKKKIPGVTYYKIDMTSIVDIARTMQEIKEFHGNLLHSVVHLVAYYSFSGEEDDRYQAITVDGTQSLLIELKKNFTVEQFIFSSTMLVYDPVTPGDKIRDHSPLNPSWPYPKSKVDTEKILKEIHAEIPIVNFRIAGVYNDFCHSPTISNQIIRIHEGWATSIPFPGNPHHGQSFLHLDDLVEATDLLIRKRKSLSSFETLVLGEEEVLSYKEMQSIIGDKLYERPWPVIRIPAFIASFGAKVMESMPFIREPFIKPWMIPHADEHFEVDITRIKTLLRWHPKRKLAQKLPVMIDHLKEDPDKWYAMNKIEKPFYRNVRTIGTQADKNQWLASIFVIFLGILLLSNSFTLGNLRSGESWTQFLVGFVITLLAGLSTIPTLRWIRWVNALLGSLLLFSPLIFEDGPAAYSNDTIIGGLIMLASVYTPSSLMKEHDKGIPPGWTYNPSTAGQRLPIMFLAFLGFILSRYLAAYQLGHIETIWEPFFGDGTSTVLTSSVSKAFPISDAGLGALTYLLDMIAAAIGDKQRWKTMPWAVILFGFMIIPAGVTSIVLIMLQPISVGAWCTICLATAFVMLVMVPPAVDEVIASVQFLGRMKRQGKAFWRIFWLGGHEEEETEVHLPYIKPQGSLLHLVGCALLGIWLMFVPAVLSIDGSASANVYIIASLITTFSIIAFSEVARITRFINVPLAIWLGISPWLMGEMSDMARWNSIVVSILIVLLSLPRGKKAQRFGSVDRVVHWTPIKI